MWRDGDDEKRERERNRDTTRRLVDERSLVVHGVGWVNPVRKPSKTRSRVALVFLFFFFFFFKGRQLDVRCCCCFFFACSAFRRRGSHKRKKLKTKKETKEFFVGEIFFDPREKRRDRTELGDQEDPLRVSQWIV